MTRYCLRIAALALAIVLGIALGPAHAGGSGTFTGASGHVTEGMVTITKNADGTATLTLSSAFFFDGAPDPRVGFGIDGAYVDAADLGELKSNTGEQTYIIPASVDPDDFNEVYIWCRKFSVPLGVARLM